MSLGDDTELAMSLNIKNINETEHTQLCSFKSQRLQTWLVKKMIQTRHELLHALYLRGTNFRHTYLCDYQHIFF